MSTVNLGSDANDSIQVLLRRLLAATTLQLGVNPLQASSVTIEAGDGGAVTVVSGDGAVSSDRVGGYTQTWVYQPAIDTNVYTAKDALGVQTPLLSILRKGVCSGILQSITVSDLAAQSPDIDFLFFNAEPAAATNNVTYAPAAADAVKFLGIASVTSDDYHAVDSGVVASVRNIGLVLKTPVSTSLGAGTVWVVPVIQSASTFTAATNLMFTFGVLQD